MKTVVIGSGRMGRRHIQVVKDMGLELVGICDINPEALALAEKEQGVPSRLHHTNAFSLLEEKRPECVIIATTAPKHCEYTCLSAKFGAKYILCEKPMAISLAECDQMLDACNRYGTRLAINHPRRFMEQFIESKKIIDSKAFGGLTSITIVAGNIGLSMNGTHYIEMFHFMTEEASLEVFAWFSSERIPNPRGEQFEDRAGSLRIATASGKRFYMEASADQGYGSQIIFSGRFGQIIIDELAGTLTLTSREEKYRDLPTTRYGMPAVRSIKTTKPVDATALARATLESLCNETNPPNGEDGRLVVAALVAAYVSDEDNHRPVTIAETVQFRTRTFPWA
jgi:predicted dehydrogenase